MSLCLAAVMLLALGLHRVILTRMDALRTTMPDGDAAAIRRFRVLHVTAIALNLAQLVILGVGLTQVKL